MKNKTNFLQALFWSRVHFKPSFPSPSPLAHFSTSRLPPRQIVPQTNPKDGGLTRKCALAQHSSTKNTSALKAAIFFKECSKGDVKFCPLISMMLMFRGGGGGGGGGGVVGHSASHLVYPRV